MIHIIMHDLQELNHRMRVGIKILWVVLLLVVFCISFSFISLVVMRKAISNIVMETLQSLPDTFDTSTIVAE